MRRTSTWTTVLAVLLLVSGCRTYGEYGSGAATYNQIERVLARSEENLNRARADLRALEQGAGGDATLSVLAAQYAELVAAHEAVLDEQRDMAAELSPDSDYRTLHRTYGAMVSEQSLLRDQYQGVLRYVYDAYSADTTRTADRDRPYALIPPYYARAADADDPLTVNEVVARVRSGSVPRAGFRIMMPDTTSTQAAGGHGEAGASHDEASGGQGGASAGGGQSSSAGH